MTPKQRHFPMIFFLSPLDPESPFAAMSGIAAVLFYR
jgi:hypothetical protein